MDWTIPQTVIRHCYNALVKPITAETDEHEVELRIFAWCHICERVGMISIENGHSLNLSVIEQEILESTVHLCVLRSYKQHFRIASMLTLLLSAMLRKRGYDEFKEGAIVMYLNYMTTHLKYVRLADMDLPTYRYADDNHIVWSQIAEATSQARDYWSFLKEQVIGQFKALLELAINASPEISDSNIEAPIGMKLSSILYEKGLTRYQQDDFLNHIYLSTVYVLRGKRKYSMTRAGLFIPDALAKMVMDNRRIAYHAMSDFIEQLRLKDEPDIIMRSMMRVELFHLGRRIAEMEPVNTMMMDCLDVILREGVTFANDELERNEPEGASYSKSMRYELKKLHEVLEGKPEYRKMVEKDKPRILKLIEGIED